MLPGGLVSFLKNNMKNYQDAAVGKRVRLLNVMLNPNSTPIEDVPVGTEGTIIFVNIHGNQYDQIGVNWDSGKALCLMPYNDHYEIYDAK